MFISTNHLVENYGLDKEIARFFVDREPPENNLYWHEKLLYLRPTPGYLFIPLIVDLLYKLGIDKHQLLSEEFVVTMEQIGHISALEETRQLSVADAISQCRQLVADNCKNKRWFSLLNDYFSDVTGNVLSKLATPFKALHRGDAFLFSICTVEFADTLMESIAEQWFALISTLLLLDDAVDVPADRKTSDENAFLESGLTPQGIANLQQLVDRSVMKIAEVNVRMADELSHRYKELLKTPHISQMLNQS